MRMPSMSAAFLIVIVIARIIATGFGRSRIRPVSTRAATPGAEGVDGALELRVFTGASVSAPHRPEMSSRKHLHHFEGGNALSDFRARGPPGNACSAAVGRIESIARPLRARVWSDAPLDRADARPAGGPAALRRSVADDGRADGTLIVAPRLGTVSPWASKATDIARNCGLACTGSSASPSTGSRLKRGLLGGGKPLDAAERDAVAAPAARPHDRERARRSRGRRPPVRRAAGRAAGQRRRRRPAASALARANREFGLALSDDEIDYLHDVVQRARPQPDRRRADDVRAGQQRALPAQDLQRRLHDRRRAAGALDVRDDPQHPCARAAAHRRRLQRQRLGDGRRRGRALAARGLHQRAAATARAAKPCTC